MNSSSGKRPVKALVVGILAIGGAFIFSEQPISAQEQVYVEVTATKLKNKPMFWAATQQELRYGDSVTVMPSDGTPEGWIHGKTAVGRTGFVHGSSVTTKKVVLKPLTGSQSRAVSDESDIVLAGKGFSKEVEKESSKRATARNYAAVNSMEQYRISDGEVLSFIKQGGLKY